MDETAGQGGKDGQIGIDGNVNQLNQLTNFTNRSLSDRWILSRLDAIVASVTRKLEANELSAAGEELRDFTWNDFADWYLEIAKIEKGKDAILLSVLETLMKLWHPFMPFVTEQIWSMFPGTLVPLIVAPWPTVAGNRDESVERDFDLVRDVTTAIRTIRSERRVEPKAEIAASLGVADRRDLLVDQAPVISQLARLSSLSFEGAHPDAGIPIVNVQVGTILVSVETPGTTVDPEKEKARLEKERDDLSAYVASTDAKLANVEFTSKAPEKVVAGMRAKRDEAKAKLDAIEAQLS